MAASDISICKYHCDRRNLRYDGWKDNNPETCCVCVTGKYPDWSPPEGFRANYPFDMKELEDHINRLLKEQYKE